MAISRLLKSCAMPPVSCPMASIFCDWSSASRACSRAFCVSLALGDVARDLGEADERAGFVADRIDHDTGPEPRAVLAHAPAFLLEPPFAPRGVERVLRLALPRDPPRYRIARNAGR